MPASRKPPIPAVENLLGEMTLQEKVGQLTLTVAGQVTGPVATPMDPNQFLENVRNGLVGGYFNVFGAELCKKLQQAATEESRLGIPLLFGADVIHGFRTIFPIPIALAASWDPDIIERCAQVIALESTASGINWNFTPCVDISRDPRWGRVAEGAGEDPYLGSEIARAWVRGLQGKDLSEPTTMAACTKHMAAYGAPEGGRDYNSVDLSERQLREKYLPPYQATVEEGVATFMTSFNELNGLPATANDWLLGNILQEEWGFNGLIVSDYNSIGELVDHGVAEDSFQAAKLSLEAGTHMDMEGNVYSASIARLLDNGQLSMEIVDEAVRRVLTLKHELGLFERPLQYNDLERERKDILSQANQETCLDAARACQVLLKNTDSLLPLLKGKLKRLAVIGPMADAAEELNGCWSYFANNEDGTTVLDGIRKKAGDEVEVVFHKGCGFYNSDGAQIDEAVEIAAGADVVVVALGESAVMSGEAASRSDIDLPGHQRALVEAIHQTGKPIVALVFSGRPLTIGWLEDYARSIILTWFLGTKTGEAVADVLFGDTNPGGKLPMTFPRNVGQIPIHYDHKQTGRMYEGLYEEPESERIYASKYRDVPNSPLYPFGYGLSYTTFEYSDIAISAQEMEEGQTIEVNVKVTNAGDHAGEEVVQLYVRDLVGSVTRPVKELKGFQKISLKPGESEDVKFELGVEDLSFYRKDMTWGAESGDFKVFVGPNSAEGLEATFRLR